MIQSIWIITARRGPTRKRVQVTDDSSNLVAGTGDLDRAQLPLARRLAFLSRLVRCSLAAIFNDKDLTELR